MQVKLNAGQKHLLRLIAKEQNCPAGWAPVSAPVYPLVASLPAELVEHRAVGGEGQGDARLTERGLAVLDALGWL